MISFLVLADALETEEAAANNSINIDDDNSKRSTVCLLIRGSNLPIVVSNRSNKSNKTNEFYYFVTLTITMNCKIMRVKERR